MHDVSAGQGDERDDKESGVRKDKALNKTAGEEGTNRTQPQPDPHAKPSEVPGRGKFIEPSPFVR
ncbi:MAG: hypothetical protein Q7T39_24620 [Polaromonas sp.]|nr:hypothetical protein [Polaromonas sp.]